jgi:AbrB family looped-hinge helix DNA binding protein
MQNLNEEITRASSRGQVVIPRDIRERLDIKEGSLLYVASKNGLIVMKKLNSKMSKEDLKTFKGIEEAWGDMANGRYKVYSKSSFSKELAKW